MTTPLENRLLAPEGRLRLSAAPQAEIAAPAALPVDSAETRTIDASDRMTGGERKRLDRALDA